MENSEFMMSMFAGIERSQKRAKDLWIVTQAEVDIFDLFLENIVHFLTETRIRDIWFSQAEHFIRKWKLENDVWSFYNSLDDMNKSKLYYYLNSSVHNNSNDFNAIQNATDFFLGLSSRFGVSSIPEIFGSTALIERFSNLQLGPNRWDLWKFYHSLDDGERKKLVDWYNDWMLSTK